MIQDISDGLANWIGLQMVFDVLVVVALAWVILR